MLWSNEMDWYKSVGINFIDFYCNLDWHHSEFERAGCLASFIISLKIRLILLVFSLPFISLLKSSKWFSLFTKAFNKFMKCPNTKIILKVLTPKKNRIQWGSNTYVKMLMNKITKPWIRFFWKHLNEVRKAKISNLTKKYRIPEIEFISDIMKVWTVLIPSTPWVIVSMAFTRFEYCETIFWLSWLRNFYIVWVMFCSFASDWPNVSVSFWLEESDFYIKAWISWWVDKICWVDW